MNNVLVFPRGIFVSAAVLLVALAANTFAQEPWRPISPVELQMTKPVVEPDADAEALIWEQRLDDTNSDKMIYSTYVRIKIFTERGRERFSKLDIAFIKGIAKIEGLRARITQPDGKSVELGEDDIFQRDVAKTQRVKAQAKALAFPNLATGTILEYQYKEVNKNIFEVDSTLDLQLDIPVQAFSFYYKPFKGRDPKFSLLNVEALKFEKAEDGWFKMVRTNVPAFKEEPWMPPMNESKALLKLDSGWYPNISMDLSARRTTIFKNTGGRKEGEYWANYSAWQKPLVDLLNDRKKNFSKLALEVVGNAATPEEKLRRIYNFCQTRINNTDYGYTPTDKELDQVDNERVRRGLTEDDFKSGKPFANTREINNVFGAMAAAVGLDPWYAVTSRRDVSFFTPELNDSRLLSFTGICVVFGGTPHIYYPGNRFLPFEMLPWYIEGAVTMYTDGKQYGWWEIPMNTFEKNRSRRSGKFRLAEDGTLAGTATIELTGQLALSYRLAHFDNEALENELALKTSIQQRITNAEVTNISIENLDDTSKPLIQHFTIKVPNYAQKTGKRMFFQPGFFDYGTTPVFAASTRKFDMFFRYPWSENDDIEIELPAGYSLDNAETPALVADAGQIGRDEIHFDLDANSRTLAYSRSFYFGNKNLVSFKASSYAAVKTLWDRFHTAETALISLKQNE